MPKERPIIYCGNCPSSKRFSPGDPLYNDAMDYYDEIVGKGGLGDYPGSLKSIQNIFRNKLREPSLFIPKLSFEERILLHQVMVKLSIIKRKPDEVFPVLVDCPQRDGWYLSIDECPDTCNDEKSML